LFVRHACFVAVFVGASTQAGAEPPREDLSAVRSQIGWGASINPDRVRISSEGGWNGGDQRVVVSAVVEATVFPRASVLVNATYGGLTDHTRPAMGVAYQLLDPRTSMTGARISMSYKPEGFSEPEGELESVLVLSRRIGGDALRAMVAYGQDPERRESDVEGGASYLHRIGSDFLVGGTMRYRRGLVLRAGEPLWDLIGGVVGGMAFGRSRIELLIGDDTIKYSSVRSGIVGLVSIGTEL
jgi:hypothetical protein